MDDLLRLYDANDYQEGEWRRPEFVNLLLEAHELLELHRGLAGITIPDTLLSRLRMLSRGPDSYAEDDRTPVFEPRVMWEFQHIRPLPLRTQQAVFCPVIDAA